MLEKDLVKSIKDYVQHLENQGKAYLVRNNSIKQQIVRKDGSKGFLVNGKPGAPDLLMCLDGKFIGIECKVFGNKQSNLQSKAQDAIESAGGEYWLVYSFDEFRTRMNNLRGQNTYVQQALI